MKRTAGIVVMIAALLSTVSLYSQQRPPMEKHGPDMENRCGPDMDMNRDGGGKTGMPLIFDFDGSREIMESYREKSVKIMKEMVETARPLIEKKKELMTRLDKSLEKFKTDSSASQDLKAILKDLSQTDAKLRVLKESAMKKLEALHKERDEKIAALNDSALKKITSDDQALKTWAESLEKMHSERPGKPGNPDKENGR